MAIDLLRCGECQEPLPVTVFDQPQACTRCHATTQIAVFPHAFQEIPEGFIGQPLADGSEASCYHHPDKRAAVPCDACGRFLCAMCDVPMGEAHYCTECLLNGLKTGHMPALQTRYIRFDLIGLTIACLPLMLFLPLVIPLLFINPEISGGIAALILIFPSLFTAPAALFISIWYRNHIVSPVPRRVWFRLANILAIAELAVWIIAVIAFIVTIVGGSAA